MPTDPYGLLRNDRQVDPFSWAQQQQLSLDKESALYNEMRLRAANERAKSERDHQENRQIRKETNDNSINTADRAFGHNKALIDHRAEKLYENEPAPIDGEVLIALNPNAPAGHLDKLRKRYGQVDTVPRKGKMYYRILPAKAEQKTGVTKGADGKVSIPAKASTTTPTTSNDIDLDRFGYNQ